jgi:hypothetical protein
MTWQWHRNQDGQKILRDEVTICNTAKGMPAGCRKQPRLDKLNPASGGGGNKNWRRRRMQKMD